MCGGLKYVAHDYFSEREAAQLCFIRQIGLSPRVMIRCASVLESNQVCERQVTVWGWR
jgi:hypothetical protein